MILYVSKSFGGKENFWLRLVSTADMSSLAVGSCTLISFLSDVQFEMHFYIFFITELIDSMLALLIAGSDLESSKYL